jgi:hypothetical protein
MINVRRAIEVTIDGSDVEVLSKVCELARCFIRTGKRAVVDRPHSAQTEELAGYLGLTQVEYNDVERFLARISQEI